MVSPDYWSSQKVIPVVVIKNADRAIDLAQTLVDAGLHKIEITLRTSGALDAIERIAKAVPDAIIGAGTILDVESANRAIAAGAKFLVSPGSTPLLLDHLIKCGLPFLAGCATVTEAMHFVERGIQVAKFFPAEESGGVNFLRSLSTVLQSIKFCPTGGINPSNYKQYLELSNVVCVGGSWITPSAFIEECAWQEISKLAREI